MTPQKAHPGRAATIAWIGFHQEGIPTLEWLIASGRAPVCAVTLTPEAATVRSARADVAKLCREAGVPVLETSSANSSETLRFLNKHGPDLLVVLGWSQILSPEVLRIPKLGTVGAHASYLPHNRGSAPVNWAIIRGETRTGNTLMWLNEGVDTGAIIDQRTFDIEIRDTCGTVYEKVAASNRDMIDHLLTFLATGRRPGRPQPKSDEPLLPRRRPRDGRIDWDQDSREIYNLVRALTDPYPGAYTTWQHRELVIWKAALLPDSSRNDRPGFVLGSALSPEPTANGVVVTCGNGRLVVLEGALEGRPIDGRELTETIREGDVLQ